MQVDSAGHSTTHTKHKRALYRNRRVEIVAVDFDFDHFVPRRAEIRLQRNVEKKSRDDYCNQNMSIDSIESDSENRRLG